MANMEDKETPNIIKPKRNKRYSKRVVITLAAVGTLILLVIGISATTRPEQRAARSEEGPEQLKMASAQQALDIDRKIWEANLPPVMLADEDGTKALTTPEKAEAEQKPLALREDITPSNDKHSPDDRARLDTERERLNQERAIRQQWLELQREAFLSSPAARGGNWSGHEKTAAQAERDNKDPRAGNTYLEIYEKYLDNEAQKNSGNSSQSDKEKFFNARNSGKGVLASSAQAPISPFMIPSGTMIPCNLITGVNSDLPGYVVAQVAENVCDWKNPDIILIPQGTRVFGIYDSKIAFAQRRVQISWSRLIYPDGTTLDLQGMPGADKRGYSGLSDKYFPRYGRLLTAAIMTAAFSSVGLLFEDDNETVVSTGGSTVVIPNNSGDDARSEFAREVADSIGNAGEQLFSKYLNTAPTVLIRPAKRFNIAVNADIPFFTSYGRAR